jgi:nucleotide-binding universal stress UspA family protein
MSYKTIMVHVDESKHLYRRVEIAARLAALDDAHLVGVALTALPEMTYDPLVFNPLDPHIDPLLQAPRQRAADALDNFDEIARQFHSGTIETRLVDIGAANGFILQARYCDLVVLGQYDPYETDVSTARDLAETVILESGIPAVVVPFAIPEGATFERILIAWNASKEATIAVRYALPLLRRAAKVDVAMFNPDLLPTDYGAVPDKDILKWLAGHGITAKVTRQATGGDLDISKGLLSLSTDLGADLLVMGCYGHARLRELVLGGVSRDILRDMTLPVLMAH